MMIHCPACYSATRLRFLIRSSFVAATLHSAAAPPLIELYRGQAVEGLGDRAKARNHYARVVRWLRQADPELAPVREEGRAALARLTVEPGTQ